MITLTVIVTIFLSEATAENWIDGTCPQQCICENAALKNAPFVVTWLTSWGEASLPEIRTNEIYSTDEKVVSRTAKDADVNINKVGLHVTCSLHTTTNTSKLLSQLPRSTMVLTLMQAPGCNLTIIDRGQLINMNSLVALHLQGYAHRSRRQVSGYTPNRGADVIAHQLLMEKELNEGNDDTRDLRLGVAEDALESLDSLELLDLQYVRLVASKDVRRQRRYTSDPITSETMVDLPLRDFLEMAKRIGSFEFPPNMDYPEFDDYLDAEDSDEDQYISNHLEIENLHPILRMNHVSQINDLGIGLSGNSLNSQSNIFDDHSVILPYEYYKRTLEPTLAPFKTLHKLKYLRVANARLDRIGAEFLEGLFKLHTLTLEFNRINLIPQMMFHSSPLIRHLSMSHNRLVAIDENSFSGLSQLLTLDLDYNNLTVLGSSSLPRLESLTTLRIEGNPLKQVLPGAFSFLNNTEELFLGSSNVSLDIHEDTFKSLPFLSRLVLRNISMDILEKNLLTGMPRLNELTLHGRIPHIFYDAFSETTSIISLVLSHLMLEKISIDAFFGLHNMKLLDISHNEISVLSPGIFDHLVNLRELYLNDNKLTTLPLGIFLPIPAKLIQLNKNPWRCTCNLLQLRPTITNKIKRAGSVFCKWDDEAETVCSKSRDRLVYNARVAPLCESPSIFHGNDVYHVALRHLHCSKHHWDPNLMKEEYEKTKIVASKKIINKNKVNKKEIASDENATVNWLPLVAFTPKPVPHKDLLQIAEEDDLEEVIEIPLASEVQSNSKVSKISKFQKDQGNNKSVPKLTKYYYNKKHLMERRRMKQLAIIQSSKNKAMKKKHFEKMMAKEKHRKSLTRSKQKLRHQKLWKQIVAKRTKDVLLTKG